MRLAPRYDPVVHFEPAYAALFGAIAILLMVGGVYKLNQF
jgi:hypothetical protein